jgi:hypothetical protein
MPIPETGIIKSALETVLKPFALIANPIAERIGKSVRRERNCVARVTAKESRRSAWGAGNPKGGELFTFVLKVASVNAASTF